MALYYSSTIHGVPPVLHKIAPKSPTLHTVNIFVTNRQIPVPNVGLKERFLVRQLGLPGFYHMVARCVLLASSLCEGSYSPPCEHVSKQKGWNFGVGLQD